jgi:hypothetical protein
MIFAVFGIHIDFSTSLEMTALQRYFVIVALGREPLLLNAIMVGEKAIRGFVQ